MLSNEVYIVVSHIKSP